MQIRFRHSFEAPRERVARAMLDPRYHELLSSLPNVGERRVDEVTEMPDGNTRVVVFCRFGGSLPSAVRSAVGSSTISWDEVGVYEPSHHRWKVEIRPRVFEGRFKGGGVYRYDDRDGVTVRNIELEIAVKMPIVGGRVERAIRDGLADAVEAEAEMLSSYLRERKRR